MDGRIITYGTLGGMAYLGAKMIGRKRARSVARPAITVNATTRPGSNDAEIQSEGFGIGYKSPVPVREAFQPAVWQTKNVQPSRFIQTDKRDTIERLASLLVHCVAMQAAKLRKMKSETAKLWADECRRTHGLVRQAADLIATGWNDECYGSPRVENKGPHGRGVDLRPVHDDNGSLLNSGRTPRRNLSSSGEPTSKGRRSRPYLWIPGINVENFAAQMIDEGGDPSQAVTCRGCNWEDGSSALWPPPLVTERGVVHGQTQ